MPCSRGARHSLLGAALAAIFALPCLAQTAPLDGAGRRVRWTADERLYHGDARLAPRSVCNAHVSATAPKDATGGACDLLSSVCRMGIKAACARVAPYRPDFHNLERLARESSLLDMSTYTALHRPAAAAPPGARTRAATAAPNARLEPKVFGGTLPK